MVGVTGEYVSEIGDDTLVIRVCIVVFVVDWLNRRYVDVLCFYAFSERVFSITHAI